MGIALVGYTPLLPEAPVLLAVSPGGSGTNWMARAVPIASCPFAASRSDWLACTPRVWYSKRRDTAAEGGIAAV